MDDTQGTDAAQPAPPQDPQDAAQPAPPQDAPGARAEAALRARAAVDMLDTLIDLHERLRLLEAVAGLT